MVLVWQISDANDGRHFNLTPDIAATTHALLKLVYFLILTHANQYCNYTLFNKRIMIHIFFLFLGFNRVKLDLVNPKYYNFRNFHCSYSYGSIQSCHLCSLYSIIFYFTYSIGYSVQIAD